MSYSVELIADDLQCRSQADAEAAARVVQQRPEMCPSCLQASARCDSHPPDDRHWRLAIVDFCGDHWNDQAAQGLWIALAPHLRSGATIELQDEDFVRWRIRWQDGGVFEDYVEEVRWTVGRTLKPPMKGSTP